MCSTFIDTPCVTVLSLILLWEGFRVNNNRNICCEFGEEVKQKVDTNINLSPMLLLSSKCQNWLITALNC